MENFFNPNPRVEFGGLDIGHGWGKIVSGEGSETPRLASFPAVVGNAIEIRFKEAGGVVNELNLHQAIRDLEIEIEGAPGTEPEKWFVGEKALIQSTQLKQTLSEQRVGTKEQRAIAAAALSLVVKTTTEKVVLTTGLPIDAFSPRTTKRLVESLKGKLTVRRKGAQTRSFEISEVLVVPQAISALYDVILDNQGRIVDPEFAQGNNAVVDIGTSHTNFGRVRTLSFVEQDSWTSDGMWKVLLLLKKHLGDAHGLEIEEDRDELSRIFREGKFWVGSVSAGTRKSINIKEWKDQAIDEFAGRIESEIKSHWRGFQRLDAILLVGGGATDIGPELGKRFENLVVPHEDPQFANARGCWKLSKRTGGNCA